MLSEKVTDAKFELALPLWTYVVQWLGMLVCLNEQSKKIIIMLYYMVEMITSLQNEKNMKNVCKFVQFLHGTMLDSCSEILTMFQMRNCNLISSNFPTASYS